MTKRTAVFIDGSNTYATAKALGIDIDYKKLLEYYNRGNLLRVYYYTAIIDDSEAFISIKPLVDWLQYNGYSVVTKPTKTWHDPMTGLTKVKGNMDGELIVQAMELIPYIDHMVLWSGDGDYTALVYGMQRHGVRVDVVSSIRTQPAMCSDELRRAADQFIELAVLGLELQSQRPQGRSKFSGMER